MYRAIRMLAPLVLFISQVIGSKKGAHAVTSATTSASGSYASASPATTSAACPTNTVTLRLTSTSTAAPCYPSTVTQPPVTYYMTTTKDEYSTITVPATTVTFTQSGSAVTVTTTETITKQEFYTVTEGGATSTMAECSGDDCPFGPGFKD
ncbi:hypothetical protein MMC18_005400 [Xylographa bjoerkii]|nr:hypothetical protein [Xylographa bjoerkii]